MTNAKISASCLCGEIRWELDGPLEEPRGDRSSVESLLRMSHCHCSRCRKVHGAPYSTYIVAKADRFRITHGRESIVRYESAPGSTRPFCGICGSVVPDGVPWKGRVGMPAGPFDDDLGVRPTCHIFVGSKAPWVEIRDSLPRFDAYPPGFDAPVLPERASSDSFRGAPRGSCLCGRVAYVVEGAPIRCRTCHCSRCRKAGSAAHVSYLATALDGVRFTRGEDHRSEFKVKDARWFRHAFCTTCGSSMPRLDAERSIAIVPMGSLDDDPGIRPSAHIYVASKAAWDTIDDDLPQHLENAPPT